MKNYKSNIFLSLKIIFLRSHIIKTQVDARRCVMRYKGYRHCMLYHKKSLKVLKKQACSMKHTCFLLFLP